MHFCFILSITITKRLKDWIDCILHMNDREEKKQLRHYEHHMWWERHKHDVIAYTIMTSMVVFFISYLVYAYLHGWDLRW